MRKLKGDSSTNTIQSELGKLLTHAEEQFPGIAELLQVYGDYEQMVLEVDQYLEATQAKPNITTSNQSCPSELGA